jgi:hypothetical protein
VCRTLDAAINHLLPKWQIGLLGTNLPNGNKIVNVSAIIPGSMQPGDTYFYARPRTIGLRFLAEFQ